MSVSNLGSMSYEQAGPTVPRMLLGAQLRRLREARTVTREGAGAVIRASESKISRLELGRTGFKLRDVSDLIDFYGISDDAERETLLTLARQGNNPGWWHAYSDLVPSWLHAYLGLEQAASVIRTFEVQFVPGLLQTTDYARAVIRLEHGRSHGSEIERRVTLRTKRQQILQRSTPPHLWAVIDEGVLRRPMGGVATLRAQLQYLIRISRLPHVKIQVMPFSAGGHAAAGGPVTLLRFPEADLPDVVYLEQLTSARYPDKPWEIEFYWDVMNRLVTEAQPPTATPGFLHRILNEL